MAGELTDDELDRITARAERSSPGPWESFIEGRDHTSGDDFIRTGGLDNAAPDDVRDVVVLERRAAEARDGCGPRLHRRCTTRRSAAHRRDSPPAQHLDRARTAAVFTQAPKLGVWGSRRGGGLVD